MTLDKYITSYNNGGDQVNNWKREGVMSYEIVKYERLSIYNRFNKR